MNKAHTMASYPVNKNATLVHTPRSNPPLAKLTDGKSAAREPLRKLFKTSSDDSSAKSSSATDATTVEKCVRFEKMYRRFRKTLSIEEYTPDELRATWYTCEDVQRMSRQFQKEIRKMNKGDKLNDKKYCSRGLEGHTKAGSALKKRERNLSINAVLKQQLAQWDKGIFDKILDEDTIAAIYIRASSSCQIWANFIGQRDQKAIEGYLGSPLSTRRSGGSRRVVSAAA
jgi:hypothetical protein